MVISDDEIVRRFQETGDTRCFTELYERNKQRVYSSCRGFFGEGGLAEDAFQETFFRAYRNIHDFRGGNFRGWLMRIARNACVDIWRDRRREVSMTEAVVDLSKLPASEALEATSEFHLAADKLRAEMQTLPADQRRCIELQIKGYSYEETAMRLGLSIKAVKSHLQNGKRMLYLRMRSALPT